MKKIRFGIVKMVDGKAELSFKEVETDNTLYLMYDEIGCDTIDIPFVSNAYRENVIDVVIDDNGKLVDEPELTALIINKRAEVIDTICGTYLLTTHNYKGDTVSLTDEQVDYISNTFRTTPTNKGFLAVLPF